MACVYIPDRLLGFIKILVIKFFFTSLVSVVVLVFSRQIIIENWGEYKCNPLVTPFAGLFGHDSAKTLQDCSHQTFSGHAIKLAGPMTNLFEAHMQGLNGLGGIMSDLNVGSSSLASVFGKGISSFMSQLTNVASTIQYLIIKIQTLLQRLVATLLVMVYSMNSLMQGVLGIQQDATFRFTFNFLRTVAGG
jgi:hypothetical protein